MKFVIFLLVFLINFVGFAKAAYVCCHYYNYNYGYSDYYCISGTNCPASNYPEYYTRVYCSYCPGCTGCIDPITTTTTPTTTTTSTTTTTTPTTTTTTTTTTLPPTTTTTTCRQSCEICTSVTQCCSHYVLGNYCYYSPVCQNYPGGVCNGPGKFCMHTACSINECTEGSSTLTVGRTCTASGCSGGTTYTCASTNCGVSINCGGDTYYCVYDNGWKWRKTRPSGFCCSNSDCQSPKSCDTSTYRCVCPSGGCEDYQGNCVNSGSFGHADTPDWASERCELEYCFNRVWYNCLCLHTNDICPPFGVHYSPTPGSPSYPCANGACVGIERCICIMCSSDNDCPPCSNNVKQKCDDEGRCKCYPCVINDDCISGYCCEKVINEDCNSDGDKGDCISGICGSNRRYLCASNSPVSWNECSLENLGKRIEINGISYQCVKESGKFKWVEEQNFFTFLYNFFKNLLLKVGLL